MKKVGGVIEYGLETYIGKVIEKKISDNDYSTREILTRKFKKELDGTDLKLTFKKSTENG